MSLLALGTDSIVQKAAMAPAILCQLLDLLPPHSHMEEQHWQCHLPEAVWVARLLLVSGARLTQEGLCVDIQTQHQCLVSKRL